MTPNDTLLYSYINAVFCHHQRHFLLQQMEPIHISTARHYTERPFLKHTAINEMSPSYPPLGSQGTTQRRQAVYKAREDRGHQVRGAKPSESAEHSSDTLRTRSSKHRVYRALHQVHRLLRVWMSWCDYCVWSWESSPSVGLLSPASM